jgi:hypothetical protein
MNEYTRIADSSSAATDSVSEVRMYRGWTNLFEQPRRQASENVATYKAMTEPPAGFFRADAFARPSRPSAGEPTYLALTVRPADYLPGSFFATAGRQTVEAVPTYRALTLEPDYEALPMAMNHR